MADVVVAGAGLAGSLVAHLLARRKLDVVLLDAGVRISAAFGQHLSHDPRLAFGTVMRERIVQALCLPVQAVDVPRATPTPLSFSTCAVGGGAATLWTGISERSDPHDEAAQRFHARCIEPYYAEAEALLGVEPSPDDVVGRVAPRLRDAAPELRDAQFVPLRIAASREPNSPRRWITGPADLLAPSDPQCGGVTLLERHVATRIEHHAGRATALACVDVVRGAEIRLAAGAIIVAADPIRSPALLFASGLRGDVAFPLGMYLSDHPMAFAKIQATSAAGSFLSKALGRPRESIPAGLRLLRPGCEHHGLVLLEPGASDTAAATLRLYWYTTGYPTETNHLDFAALPADEYGLPTPLACLPTPLAPQETLGDMSTDLAAAAKALGEPLRGWQPRMMPVGSARHTFGTLRSAFAGSGPGVTDECGRVNGFSNLYVAGPARIPYANSSYPALAAAALAIQTGNCILSAHAAHHTTRQGPAWKP